MRRFITVIIIILILVSLLLGGAWLISRRKATQNGATPLSFRQFLSGQTNPANPNDISNDGTLTPIFVDDNTSTPQTPDTVTAGTQIAVFTNPDVSTPVSTPTSTGSNNNPSTTTPPRGTGNTDPVALPPALVPPVIPSNECSDADLNIRFTPEDLVKLQKLQNRFYAIATNLHTDGDVAIETGNHDNFKSKVKNVTDMYNYCIAKAPKIYAGNLLPMPLYKTRVPTPFWHEATQDSEVFLGGLGPIDGALSSSGISRLLDPGGFLRNSDVYAKMALRSLERSLRLNLW